MQFRRRLGLVLLAVIVLAWLAQATAASAMTITWRVENTFRLFADPAAVAQHRATWEMLSSEERRTPIRSVERQLGNGNPRGWAEAWIDQLCWSGSLQRHACPSAHQKYAHPETQRVILGIEAAPSTTCVWTIGSRARLAARHDERDSRSCRESFTIDVPYPSGVTVSVTSSGRTATAAVRVRDLFVVGIGDSYASGDGNPDGAVRFDDRRSTFYRGPGNSRLDGYPARSGAWTSLQDPAFRQNGPRWMSSACHRSLYGHHLRAALQLALEDPHRAVTFASFACWGSDIVNGLFLPIKPSEIVPDLPSISQVSAVAELQCSNGQAARKDWPRAFEMSGHLPELVGLNGLYCPPAYSRRIDLLLVAVGGNDVGFAQLVANAVLKDATPLRQISGLVGQIRSAAEARRALQILPERYALNRAAHSILHIPWAEADRIVLTSYPPIALDDDTRDACAGGRDGMTVTPAFDLDQQRTRDNERLGQELHAIMRREAARHGWTFVDAHREAFTRHGLCAGRPKRLANPADDLRLPRYREAIGTHFHRRNGNLTRPAVGGCGRPMMDT